MKKFKLGSWIVEPNKSLLTSKSGKEVRIEPLNMALLYHFLQSPNDPISREKLIEDVWDNKIVTDHAVYKTINQLRKYLASDGDTQDYIKTIPKKGYALIAPIEEIIEVDPKTAINIQLETDSANSFKKWFYKHPVMHTLGIVLFAGLLTWNFGLSSWWYRITFPEYSTISVNNIMPGVKAEVVPSQGDKFLLISARKEELDSKRGLFILHQETNKYYQLLDDKYDYSKLSWSKVGDKLVVSRRPASTALTDKCDLLILSLNDDFNAVVKQDVVAQCSPYGSSSFYDDERNILIYSYAKSEIHPASLFQLDLNTNEVQVLTNSGEAAFGDWSIRISPNYKQIAFLRVHEEFNELRLLDLVTQENSLLHTFASYSDQISWSHDSSKIFYQGLGPKLSVYSLKYGFNKSLINRDDDISFSYHSRASKKVYMVANELNQDIKVGIYKDKKLSSISWQTSSLSFEKFPSFANTSDDFVFVSNRVGVDQVFLYKDQTITQLTFTKNENEVIVTPRWSPVDDKILFGQGGKAYIYDFASNKSELLYAEDGVSLLALLWDNTGKNVFFSKKIDKRNEIFKINIQTKLVKQVTANGGYGGTVGPHGNYLYYVKEDHFGLWRLNLQTQEDIKISSQMKLDAIYSLQIYPEFLTYSLTDDYSRWISYKLDYETLTEELIYDGKLADSRFNKSNDKVIWSEMRQISNKFLTYEQL